MRNHYHSDLLVQIQVDQDLHDDVRAPCVEVTSWLIKKKNRWIIRNGSRDRYTLLFTTRELIWEMIQTRPQSDILK